jgi:hypothetical protein
MKAAELRQKDVAGVKEESQSFAKSPLRFAYAKRYPTTQQHIATLRSKHVEALHAPKPSLLKSKPPNKDNEDDGSQKIPQTHLDWQGGQ